MNKLVGVVSKPQFDINVFKVGNAVHVKQVATNGYVLFDAYCIISETNPLYLIVHYYSEIEYEITNIQITIDNVVSGEYTISLIKEV
ncbi:TPA: hypothetical protein PTW06_001006 [Clostridium botulinum]|nr:hypothetical protein [Clostridium botulinum]HDK7223513.1 hypothetical protein [Clostridium botulinum]HDK7271155.1 hypothetical protein [Clostridium botulinum]HDK7304511.1 hypothetical protein [Clostridium botulinum]